MLDCTVETACSYMRRGLLPGVKLGGRWRASREEVVARIEALSDSRCSCGAATSWPPAGVDATGRPVCSRCAGGAAWTRQSGARYAAGSATLRAGCAVARGAEIPNRLRPLADAKFRSRVWS